MDAARDDETPARELETRADNYQAFVDLLRQSRRQIDIFSDDWDKRLYDQDDILGCFQSLIRRNRQARIRLLLRNPRHLVQHGHRIIELARRLSSYIEIRQRHEDFDEHCECFSLFDHGGIVYRPHCERFEGWFRVHAPLRVKSQRELFEAAWNASPPCQEARRLYL